MCDSFLTSVLLRLECQFLHLKSRKAIAKKMALVDASIFVADCTERGSDEENMILLMSGL